MDAIDWFIIALSSLVTAVQMINLLDNSDRSWGMNAFWIVIMLLNILIILS